MNAAATTRPRNRRIWLACFPGSPFARMARVLIREWALPVEEVEYPFPPTDRRATR